MKKIILIVVILVVLVLIGVVAFGEYKAIFEKNQNPVATLEVENYGTIKLELYPKIAPNTVSNFIKLSNNGFYDGLTFHRIIKDFMIQGGDVLGDGTGSPKLSDIRDDIEKDSEEDKDYAIKGEFSDNGYEENNLKFVEGVLAMARSGYSNDSAGSQFFITTKDSTSLNGSYCGFGKVIEGMDVVQSIAETEIKVEESEDENSVSEEQSTPVNPPVIKSIRVETFGVDYGTPETMDAFDYEKWLNEYYKNLGLIVE